MGGERDGSTGALALSDGQVLVEGRRALDGWSVAAHNLVDVCQTISMFPYSLQICRP